MFTAGIITVSDKGSQGKREDLSGPAIAEMLAGAAIVIKHTLIIPDKKDQIQKYIIFSTSFSLDVRQHFTYCETPIPKAKRIGIGKLNNPAKRRV